MADEPHGSHRYEIRGSGAIAQSLRRVQQQAVSEGRGEQALAAIREIARRLQLNPSEQGEPLYSLPALHMQIRSIAVRPLVVDFGVCEDRPLVFIKAVTLLSAKRS
jgi:hypothetical protein